MGYPQGLDEIDEVRLVEELERREKDRERGLCDYCGRQRGVLPSCRFSDRHNWGAVVDVTVRIPVVVLGSGSGVAGFIQGAVTRAMREQGWAGEAFVLWREDDGRFVGFGEGGSTDPYEGVLPHAEG